MLSLPALAQQPMAHSISELQGWQRYPDYPTYVEYMDSLAQSNHGTASLVEIGRSASGRQILAMRITAPGDTSARPSVLLSSTIHGDELTGYMLSLRLIDSLLSDPENTMPGTQAILYIAPLLNPDGTYGASDTSIIGPSRYNANGIDLNRNFPPLTAEGEQPELQPETKAIMSFAESRRFSFSVSLHCGDEVVNYPWDSFKMGEMSLPDLEWWQAISRQYVDTLRAKDSTTLRTVCDEGHVFGSQWYKVSGGMQDWMYSQMRCRETTIEISRTKATHPSRANEYWELCSGAIITFLKHSGVGFSGSVTDTYGNPIADATIIISGHDENCSSVTTNRNGIYFRPSMPDITMEACAVAAGYKVECQVFSTGSNSMEQVDFVMEELQTRAEIAETMTGPIRITTSGNAIMIDASEPINKVEVYSIAGKCVGSISPHCTHAECPTHNLADGIYVIRTESTKHINTQKIAIFK